MNWYLCNDEDDDSGWGWWAWIDGSNDDLLFSNCFTAETTWPELDSGVLNCEKLAPPAACGVLLNEDALRCDDFWFSNEWVDDEDGDNGDCCSWEVCFELIRTTI